MCVDGGSHGWNGARRSKGCQLQKRNSIEPRSRSRGASRTGFQAAGQGYVDLSTAAVALDANLEQLSTRIPK